MTNVISETGNSPAYISYREDIVNGVIYCACKDTELREKQLNVGVGDSSSDQGVQRFLTYANAMEDKRQSLFLRRPLPRPEGVTAARCLQLGANTP